jgi:hypothetical protein
MKSSSVATEMMPKSSPARSGATDVAMRWKSSVPNA